MNREKIESYLHLWAEYRETDEARSEIGYPKSTVEARLFQPPSGKPAGTVVPVSLSVNALMAKLNSAYIDLDDEGKQLVRFRFLGSTGKEAVRVAAYCRFAKCTERTYRNRYSCLMAYYRGYFAAIHVTY